jgi:hypothetical protein
MFGSHKKSCCNAIWLCSEGSRTSLDFCLPAEIEKITNKFKLAPQLTAVLTLHGRKSTEKIKMTKAPARLPTRRGTGGGALDWRAKMAGREKAEVV